MSEAVLKEIRERREYASNQWSDSHDDARVDMRFVALDPWDEKDRKQRKNRPLIAPDEMGQYFNQVINAARANPTGMKFSPVGNGASPRGAEFYQKKAREIEYRSHAQIAYITALENALWQSFGYIRIETRFESPRSANQEIWIEGFPDPHLVMPDPDAKRPDSSDMQYCFVERWTEQSEHKRRKGSKLKASHFKELSSKFTDWVKGDKILEAEYWTISTRPRQLWLVQPPPTMVPGQPPQRPQEIQIFEDEFDKYPNHQPIKFLREVDYPTVKQYFTNGLEILGEATDWPGKYIPIVSCYGKILYVPENGETKRELQSMTRAMRDPWKMFCWTCCLEAEILAMTPKAPLQAYRGQLNNREKTELKESMHSPKALLEFGALSAATGQQILPPPSRVDYSASQHLAAIQAVKESWRRSIQAAAGSNFLPTNAQRHNEKSGVALDKIDQSAAQGTFHFIYARNMMVRQTGIIIEDLITHVHSNMGKTGVMGKDENAETVDINDPDNDKAYDTRGDYLATVSTGPSSESERSAVSEFTDLLVSNIQVIAEVSGKPAAAKVLAQSVRNKNLGTGGDQLAEIIEPPMPPGPDGKPLPPEAQAILGKLQQTQQQLQQANQKIEMDTAKEQAKQDGQFRLEAMKFEKDAALKLELQRNDLAAKIEIARIGQDKQVSDPAIEAAEEREAIAIDISEAAKDRQHEREMSQVDHLATAALSRQEHGQDLTSAAQAAALAPPPTDGASA